MIIWLFAISANDRVEQKDSLYFGSCKKLVTTSVPSSQLTSVVAGQPTYCDCSSDMQTCAPGRDVVNCVSSTSTGRGGHLPGICCCPISQHSTFSYITHIGSDIDNKKTTSVIIIFSSHHPLFESSTVPFFLCPDHPFIINSPCHYSLLSSSTLFIIFCKVVHSHIAWHPVTCTAQKMLHFTAW